MLQTDLMQLRMQERKREMQLREKEDERIRALSEKMADVRGSDMELDLKQHVLESLTNQINQIYENREQREQMAAEQEMMRKKAVLEEATQMRDVPMPEEEGNIQGLTRIAVAQDRLSELQQTRASLTEQAGHLERAIHSENSNYTLVGGGAGVDTIIAGQRGAGQNDFRNQELAKLNLGIARTNAAINQAIASMYRDSAKLQEDWLEQGIPGQARNDGDEIDRDNDDE